MCFVDVVCQWHQPDRPFFLHQIPLSYLVPLADKEPLGEEHWRRTSRAMLFKQWANLSGHGAATALRASQSHRTLQVLHLPVLWLRITENSTSSLAYSSMPYARSFTQKKKMLLAISYFIVDEAKLIFYMWVRLLICSLSGLVAGYSAKIEPPILRKMKKYIFDVFLEPYIPVYPQLTLSTKYIYSVPKEFTVWWEEEVLL